MPDINAGQRILLPGDPTTGLHAATKQYVDTNVASMGVFPAGTVVPFAGSSAPSGWLLCAGQAVSRTTYSNLYAIIGTTYGAGDGSTTFNLPDLRGRVPAGLDNMNGTDAGRLSWANTLGTNGGAQTHTLSTAEMPSHTHDVKSDHTNTPKLSGTVGGGVAEYGIVPTGGWTVNTPRANTFSAAASGGNGSHNNMQPTILLNYIISIGIGSGIGSGISKPVGTVVYGSGNLTLTTSWLTVTWESTSFNDAGVTGGNSIYRLTPGTWDIWYNVASDSGLAGGAYFELIWRYIGGSWSAWYEGMSSLQAATGYAGAGAIRNSARLHLTWAADVEIALQGYAYGNTRTVSARELIMWKLG